jgi:hypothetical protein
MNAARRRFFVVLNVVAAVTGILGGMWLFDAVTR